MIINKQKRERVKWSQFADLVGEVGAAPRSCWHTYQTSTVKRPLEVLPQHPRQDIKHRLERVHLQIYLCVLG